MGKKSKQPKGPKAGDFIGTSMLPQFQKCHEEAIIIGRLLAGYGELEFFLYLCVAHFYGGEIEHNDEALRLLYKERGENKRIEKADKVLRPYFDEIKLTRPYAETIEAMHHCRMISNQFAHCQWHPNTSAGLFFGDLEGAARRKERNARINFYHVDVELLAAQEDFFAYTQGMLGFCGNRILKVKKLPEAILFRRPEKRSAPPFYNPPDKHQVPRWADADE